MESVQLTREGDIENPGVQSKRSASAALAANQTAVPTESTSLQAISFWTLSASKQFMEIARNYPRLTEFCFSLGAVFVGGVGVVHAMNAFAEGVDIALIVAGGFGMWHSNRRKPTDREQRNAATTLPVSHAQYSANENETTGLLQRTPGRG